MELVMGGGRAFVNGLWGAYCLPGEKVTVFHPFIWPTRPAIP